VNLVRRVEEPAFGLEQKFGNRVEVLPGEAFGGSHGVRRNGDCEASGWIDPVDRNGWRVYL
jgi:hypothetical protein